MSSSRARTGSGAKAGARLPVFSAAETRAAEGRVVSPDLSWFALMRRAAEAVADAASAMTPEGGRILVLCGPGKNGGDGYVAATILLERGYDVTVAATVPPATLSGDAGLAAAGWSRRVLAIDEIRPAAADLVVDGIFGIGLARPLDAATAASIEAVNGSGTPVLAVDIPSGIDADTGEVRGAALRATRTVTFVSRKPGHLLLPGRAHAGEVTVADLGIPARILAELGGRLEVNGPPAWQAALHPPRPDGHKYDRGHAVILSGPPTQTGAARLAARGALRAGAGLVTVATPARAVGVNAAHLTAIMLRVCEDPDELSDLLTDDRFNALALGPGLGVGEETRGWVGAALEADRATVLDADALTSFAGDLDGLAALTRAGREAPVVLTPHEGEFKRLFGAGAAGRSKVDRAREAAERTGAVVVLKGPDTVVAGPDGRAVINVNGSPWLATAGSGDVLTGMVAGLLAQGAPGFEAAAASVWMHGDAATRFGPGLVSEDLPEMLPAVLRALQGGS